MQLQIVHCTLHATFVPQQNGIRLKKLSYRFTVRRLQLVSEMQSIQKFPAPVLPEMIDC